MGGLLNTIGSNARLGKGEYIVLEADESDGSFLLLSPTMAVVTNIEADHLDHYKDLAEIKEAFLQFVNKVPFYGAAVLCLDDPAVQSLIPENEAPVRDLWNCRAGGRFDRGIDALRPWFDVHAALQRWNNPAIRVARSWHAQRSERDGGVCCDT